MAVAYWVERMDQAAQAARDEALDEQLAAFCEDGVAVGRLRSLRAPWHSMGSAGRRAARLKPRSAKGRMLQNRRHHLLPPSGVAPARELVAASYLVISVRPAGTWFHAGAWRA
jgi:hypothetical protein